MCFSITNTKRREEERVSHHFSRPCIDLVKLIETKQDELIEKKTGCLVLGDACPAGWCCVPVCRRHRRHFWRPDGWDAWTTCCLNPRHIVLYLKTILEIEVRHSSEQSPQANAHLLIIICSTT